MTSGRSFGIWITGLPASGKSTIARALVAALAERGVRPVVLESDALREILTPQPSYRPEERDRFYEMLAGIGAVITRSGVPVIIDATANLRRYRDRARAMIPRFAEVYVACSLDTCRQRDPKGIYARAKSGGAETVPGLQTPYEPPLFPEVTIDCTADPAVSATTITGVLHSCKFL